MELLEYQTKQYLAQYGIDIPENYLVSSAEVAHQVLDAMQGHVVIRPQTLPVSAPIYLNLNDVNLETTINNIFYYNDRFMGTRSYVIERVPDIVDHIDLHIQTERSQGKIQVRLNRGSYTAVERVNALLGVQDYQVRALASDLGLARDHWEGFTKTMQGLLQCYIDSDAEFLQVARLGITPTGELVAAEAEMRVDRNAIHRQGNLFALSAAQQIDPIQIQAQKANISYVSIVPTGDVTCVANGSGLCMALLDEVRALEGVEPSVFIDMGDIIKLDRIRVALRLAHASPGRFLLIALYSGNQDCQEIAQVILDTCGSMRPAKQVILQMRGQGAQQAAELAQNANYHLLVTTKTVREAVHTLERLNHEG